MHTNKHTKTWKLDLWPRSLEPWHSKLASRGYHGTYIRACKVLSGEVQRFVSYRVNREKNLATMMTTILPSLARAVQTVKIPVHCHTRQTYKNTNKYNQPNRHANNCIQYCCTVNIVLNKLVLSIPCLNSKSCLFVVRNIGLLSGPKSDTMSLNMFIYLKTFAYFY